MFFCGFFAIKNTQTAEALTSGNSGTINYANHIGDNDSGTWDENDDLWDSTNQRFNFTVFYNLKKELFGSVDPVTYIQDTNNGAVIDTGSTLITAATLNTKAGSNYGYIVKLGGLDWIITSLTLDDSNNPIMTLLLADHLTNATGGAVKTVYVSDGTSSSAQTSTREGRNTYSSSKLRNLVISEEGDYAKLKLFDKSTDATTNKNAAFEADFLVQPKNIAYQRQETQVGRTGAYKISNVAYNFANEAIEDLTSGWHSGHSYAAANTYNHSSYAGLNARYDAWGSDYIWIPSITETGLKNYLTDSCIWQLSNDQRKVSTQIYTRSGVCDNYGRIVMPTTDYTYDSGWAYGNLAIRPALHLNLNAAEISAGVPVPEDTELTYTGDTPDYSAENWYFSDYQGNTSICKISYKNSETGQTLSAVPTAAGKYTVTFALQGNYVWLDGTTGKRREIDLTINPKPLNVIFGLNSNDVPELTLNDTPFDGDTVNCVIRYYDSSKNEVASSELRAKTDYIAVAGFDNPNYIPNLDEEDMELPFTNPATRVKASFVPATQEYNGSTRYFTLVLTGGATATATLKEGYGEDVTQISNTRFSAENAGKYEVTLSLDNKDECLWDSTGKTDDITTYFEITPLTKQLTVLSYSSSWSVTEGNTTTATIEMPPLLKDTARVIVGAYYMGTLFDNLCAIDLSTATTHSQVFTLETGTLPSNITYELGIDYDDPNAVNAKNYKFEFVQTYKFTVKEPSLAGGVNWRLMADGAVVGNQTDNADTNSTTYGTPITYSGKNYSFTINATGIGYDVATSYNENGFINGYKTVKASAPTVALSSAAVKDAGDYITYVHLTNDEGEEDYSIGWTIDKAKFDLSGVRWLPKDGRIAFSARMSIVIDPETLPEGLSVKQYDGSHSATAVGDEGQAIVIFQVADSNNYVLPVSTDSSTYIFNANDGLTDFEWSKDWEVVPAEIPVEWTVGTVTASGNKKVNAKMLAGNYDAYLDYVYYESDGRGNVADGAEPISELSIIEGTVKYYVAEVSIKSNFEGQYVLEAGKSNRSTVFEVGHTLTAVQLAARKTQYSYWGQPVEFQFKVTQGTVTESAFEITYYKGTLRQLNPPKDVGSYTAQISLKSEFANDYYIDGRTSFDFTIERAVIAINWNEGTKPPALKITQEQKACISYEYIGSSGNSVSFNGLSRGVYKIRAVINSASTKNYIFDNHLTYTDWVEFTVTGSETLIDPDNSNLYSPGSDPNISKIFVTIFADANRAEGFSNNENLPSVYFNVKYYSLDEERYLAEGELPGVAGGYRVEVALKDAYTDRYELTNNTVTFTLSGNIENPPSAEEPDKKDDGAEGDNPSDNSIISYLPVILSGISLVLIVVFAIMAMNNASAAKKARAKAKKLATMSYSFAPAGLLALVFGLSEGNWWIIAGVLMGLALIMAIVAFMFRSKKNKALEALEEEQERIAEEKELAREEKEMAREAERDRRDNEMKMMFAAMQQGGYQQPMYDDSHMQNMIASTISALLPALQQQMALPPAQSDPSAYAAPQPDYAARAENEELRAQLAQQQELLNQLLQNQQAQQAAINEALYEEPEPVDDISWLGESDEVISLEESYGALSDEGRRAYYEIGSYIMNKPRTSQNDGRYAVLFKYRGRTIFKLAIKDDAPVLYYPSGSGRAEVRVVDGSSLEVAKGMIDRTVAKVDSEM